MKIMAFDHIVITVSNIEKTLSFYCDVLGMSKCEDPGRYAVKFGRQKINFHTRPKEFLPAADSPSYGSSDICLVSRDSISCVINQLTAMGVEIELGPVERNGARGVMDSVYIRDPDKNLIEICVYR